ncbi:MAG: transketolase C-terminal domain-containing protein [Bdellovibrionota bacterium]
MTSVTNFENYFDSNVKAKATRAAFGEFLAEAGSRNSRIVVLDADLSKSTQTQHFAKKFPKRFFNMGIAEANMIGTAAGLARAGFIPFAASFACFLTGRFDQIRMSVSFTGTNVRLVGTHAGVGIGEDGHSQMGLEDIALMRSLPNMTVLQPADEQDTLQLMEWSLTHNGPCYFRLTRQNLKAVKWKKDKAAVGMWDFLHTEQTSIVLISSGGLLGYAFQAAEQLKADGHAVSVVNASWLNPIADLNFSKIKDLAPNLVVSVEDHYTFGGLGTAVAEELVQRQIQVPLLKVGVNEFGASASPKDNLKTYGLDAEGIYKQVKEKLRHL